MSEWWILFHYNKAGFHLIGQYKLGWKTVLNVLVELNIFNVTWYEILHGEVFFSFAVRYINLGHLQIFVCLFFLRSWVWIRSILWSSRYEFYGMVFFPIITVMGLFLYISHKMCFMVRRFYKLGVFHWGLYNWNFFKMLIHLYLCNSHCVQLKKTLIWLLFN